MVYRFLPPVIGMWWLLVYYVFMQVPKGLVDTDLHKGRLQVGDQEHWVRPGHELVTVRRVRENLVFTFREK